VNLVALESPRLDHEAAVEQHRHGGKHQRGEEFLRQEEQAVQ
jgi:hypothetical protein